MPYKLTLPGHLAIFFFFLSCNNTGSKFTNAPIDLEEVDFTTVRPIEKSVDSRDTTMLTGNFKFDFVESSLPAQDMVGVTEICEGNIKKLLAFLDKEDMAKQVPYRIFPGIEKKGLSLQNGALHQVDHSSGMAYAVVNHFFDGHKFHPENEIVLRELLGRPVYNMLEKGLSIYLNDSWQLKGYDYWAGKLFTSGNLPPLSELMDESLFEKESDLVMGCAAASFVDFLINKSGKASFIKEYATFEIKTSEIRKVNDEWKQYLKGKYQERKFESNQMKNFPWLKGFNFAHEGYRVYNGYGSHLAAQSMEKMFSIGSNTVAIVPYSYMRADDNPTFLPIMRRAGTETDESVIATHMKAKSLKGYTMLKPQIWMRGSWPGSIKMKSEKDWNRFFDYYYRWMRHYALIAEIWEMDMLCVGVEFAEATQSHPEKWKELITKLRGIYSGPMVYAANWGDEFEKITFWEELDYIGLNCYYPLSKKASPNIEELKAGFNNTIKKIESVCEQYGKPLIFTEIGFRSVEKTWRQPHEEPNGKPANVEHQRLCYEIVFEAIQSKPWCKGIIWWKWPSHLDYKSRGGTEFTPSNKPAQEIVEQYFKFTKG